MTTAKIVIMTYVVIAYLFIRNQLIAMNGIMNNMCVTNYRNYPIALIAYNIPRWEKRYGGDVWDETLKNKLVFFKKKDFSGPTHLQYSSKYGFLVTWPLCFHFWYQFKPQEYNKNGYRVPGSEIVLYGRAGIRWDAGDGIYVCPSFYLGGHWD